MARLVLDANLLLLLVVGDADRREIARHKRLGAYQERDYDLLLATIEGFRELVITPNVASEASNLLRLSPKAKHSAFARSLALIVRRASERYIESREAVVHPSYRRLGLTDAAILRSLGEGDNLLTADLGLYLAALAAGCRAENFTHLREARGF